MADGTGLLTRRGSNTSVSSNLTVSANSMTLNDLKKNDSAVIDTVTNKRLQQMGIVATRTVTVLRRMTGCLHIRFGYTEWAIRDQDAKSITIKE